MLSAYKFSSLVTFEKIKFSNFPQEMQLYYYILIYVALS